MDFDFENALISGIIEQKDIRTVIKHKITPEFFSNTQCRAAYVWLLEWYRNPDYGDTPSWEVFWDTFTEFEGNVTDDSVVALCDKVRESKLYSDIAAALQKIGEVTSGDPSGGFAEMKALTARLTSQHTVDHATDARDRIGEIREEYFAMKTGKTGLKGKPYPWETLNQSTLGCQDGQVVVIYGRPKSYKTWLALECMRNFHEHGDNILIFSQELTDIEIARRFVALSCGVDYTQFLRGQLPPDVEADFLENLEAFAEQPPCVIDMLDGRGDEIGIEMSTKIDEMGATKILIDGAHTLGGDWKELSALTRTVKRVAKQKNIPIMMTTHAHRRGGNVQVGGSGDDIAHSDSFFQDCDLALRCLVEIENRRKKEVLLWTSALREGVPCAFSVHTILAQNMTEKTVMKIGGEGEEDIEGAIDDAAFDGEEDERE